MVHVNEALETSYSLITVWYLCVTLIQVYEPGMCGNWRHCFIFREHAKIDHPHFRGEGLGKLLHSHAIVVTINDSNLCGRPKLHFSFVTCSGKNALVYIYWVINYYIMPFNRHLCKECNGTSRMAIEHTATKIPHFMETFLKGKVLKLVQWLNVGVSVYSC